MKSCQAKVVFGETLLILMSSAVADLRHNKPFSIAHTVIAILAALLNIPNMPNGRRSWS